MATNGRFVGPRFDAAANNNPPMKTGETGDPVRRLQQALIELGHPLPISTKKYGSPDGVYGDETFGAVKAFQIKNGLVGSEADGRVGKNTLAKLRSKTLPPARPLPVDPGKPTPTQTPEQQLKQLIVRTLDEPAISSVDFVIGRDEINVGWFRLIRNLVDAG